MVPKRLPLLALAVCALVFVARVAVPQIRPAHASLPSQTEGHFTEGAGWYPGEPFVTAESVRAWGSWTGSDAHTGSLIIGPFRAGDRVRFGVSGYPTRGNELHLELAATRERLRIQHPDIGERWVIAEHVLPPSWRHELVLLIAIDRGQNVGGWIAVTEPIRGDRSDGARGLWVSLAGAAITAAILGPLWLAIASVLSSRRALPPQWLPLGAAAIVALFGYVAFWAWFAHPVLGKLTSLTVIAGAAIVLWRQRSRPSMDDAPEHTQAFRDVARLLGTICLLYLGALHLFPLALDFYSLAANRFRDHLPADNILPHQLTARIAAGESLRDPDADWLTSDRPPLQTGWQLLVLPLTDALGLDRADATGTASLWLQLLWVAGAYGLLRTLGLNAPRSVGWTAVLGLSGFFIQNTIFTWPKLSAAAFAVGAFALLLSYERQRVDAPSPRLPLSPSPPLPVSHLTWPALFAALAWLSHGGAAFSFLVLLPWLAWRACRSFVAETRDQRPPGSKSLVSSLWPLVFCFLLVLPWVAYQKFYDPPGNRLLKWHLGGQIEKDPRGTLQTIRENYAALTWPQIVERKRSNFVRQVSGNWSYLFDVSPSRAVERRNDEFFHFGRALTWWNAGLLALPLVWFRLQSVAHRGTHLALAAWIAFTVLVWCLLMFLPDSAIPHQGSYAMILAAFALLSSCLELASRYSLIVAGLLQAATFATTWLPSNPVVAGSPQPIAVAVLIAAAASLAVLILAAFPRFGNQPKHSNPRPALNPAA